LQLEEQLSKPAALWRWLAAVTLSTGHAMTSCTSPGDPLKSAGGMRAPLVGSSPSTTPEQQNHGGHVLRQAPVANLKGISPPCNGYRSLHFMWMQYQAGCIAALTTHFKKISGL